MHTSLSWGRRFVDSVHDLVSIRRKLLLTYDAYRSRITLAVLDLFKDSNIIFYALPAHTSGKLKPLDVVIFSSFKKALNDAIHLSCTEKNTDIFIIYEFCRMLNYAHRTSFTAKKYKLYLEGLRCGRLTRSSSLLCRVFNLTRILPLY